MIACPTCAFEASDDSAFCSKCGTKLVPPQAMTEERKTVTTLICDLVGFTAMSEVADPEDVDRVLNDYIAVPPRSSSPTAAPSRNSSATPSSASSACRLCMRTTPNGPSGQACASSRRWRA